MAPPPPHHTSPKISLTRGLYSFNRLLGRNDPVQRFSQSNMVASGTATVLYASRPASCVCTSQHKRKHRGSFCMVPIYHCTGSVFELGSFQPARLMYIFATILRSGHTFSRFLSFASSLSTSGAAMASTSYHSPSASSLESIGYFHGSSLYRFQFRFGKEQWPSDCSEFQRYLLYS